MLAAAEAARAAVVLEAHARGVIDSSDNPRVDKYVEQACREAGVPVTTRHAATLRDIIGACDSHDVAPVRDAVVTGRISLDAAAMAARFYRRIRPVFGPGDWAPILGSIIEAVADGATARDLNERAEQLIGQYSDNPGDLDAEHEASYAMRSMSTFRRAKDGMLTATIRLDPASEAALTAAITALSAPRTDPAPDLSDPWAPTTSTDPHTVASPHGDLTDDTFGSPGANGGTGTGRDERTAGQRRADALLALAGVATSRRGDLPLSGEKAKILVTISHDALTTELTGARLRPAHRTPPRLRPDCPRWQCRHRHRHRERVHLRCGQAWGRDH